MHLVDFFGIFCREDNLLVTSYLLTQHQAPSQKGSTLKGKNLLPRGANSFLLE